MRLGIRAQLLLSLGALLLAALVPLFFAVASLTRASLSQSWQANARVLGRVVSGHLSEARQSRTAAELQPLLEAQLGHGVGAVGIYDRAGRPIQQAGPPGAAAALPATVAPDKEQVLDVKTDRGAAIVVLVPGRAGPVGVLVHTDPSALQIGPLVRLVALYTGLLGLALLVFSYLVLTRIVISPVEQLRRAAGRVAAGARQLTAPRAGGRELVELGGSLARMTEKLLSEEEELRRKVAEIEAAAEELKQAQDTLIRSERLASVGRLAAGLAHEIGNPISAILGFQQLLLDDDSLSPAEQRDFLLRMQRETERISKVLRDLLDFARPAAARSGAEPADPCCSVSEAVEQVLALVRPQKSLAGVELTAAVGGDLPAVAMVRDQLEQVLLNLLLNAAAVVPRPGGRIALEATAADRQSVRLVIEDNGGGIPPEIKDRLFEPFVTTKEIGAGTGLGLAVCRGLIESAGGQITVEDGAAGARFVLELPAASCADEEADRLPGTKD